MESEGCVIATVIRAGGGGSRWKPVGIDLRRLRRKKAIRQLVGDPVLPNRIQDGLKISPVTTSALNLARWLVQLQLTVITLQSEILWISQDYKSLYCLIVVVHCFFFFSFESELTSHQQLYNKPFRAGGKDLTIFS